MQTSWNCCQFMSFSSDKPGVARAEVDRSLTDTREPFSISIRELHVPPGQRFLSVLFAAVSPVTWHSVQLMNGV